MAIQVFTMKDYQEVYDFWLNTSGMGLNDVDDSPDGIARFIKRNPTSCFLCKMNGQVVGTILAGHDGRRGHIYHMAVSEKYQGQGIGTQLLEQVVVALKAENVSKITLVVFKNNQSGNKFWEKRGFEKREDLVYRNHSLVEMIDIET